MTSGDRNKFPKKVKIVDQVYSVLYFERMTDVDVNERQPLTGQVDFQSHTIRVYKPKNFSETEIWNSIFHEALHAIVEVLKIKPIQGLSEEDEEHTIHMLATGINAVVFDNKFNFEKRES